VERLGRGGRSRRVRVAVAAGVSKHRVYQLTGSARTTIDRILATPAGASTVPPGGPMTTDVNQGGRI
jgi:hypothetical protein